MRKYYRVHEMCQTPYLSDIYSYVTLVTVKAISLIIPIQISAKLQIRQQIFITFIDTNEKFSVNLNKA